MPKIDFDSDSAPFSGSVLPTIEDVAALGDRLEKEVVDPIPRIDPARASTVQKLLLPVALCLAAAVAISLHILLPSPGQEDSADLANPAYLDPSEVPTSGVRDMRIIAKVVSPEIAELALRSASSAQVTLVFPKGREIPDKKKLAAAKVTLYPVNESVIASEGVLLDGLRWLSFKP